MTTWTHDDLETIGTADEVKIAPLRRDGTVRRPVTIWVVRVGDDLLIRFAPVFLGRPQGRLSAPKRDCRNAMRWPGRA
jgi:hypothetical protein